MARKLLLLLLLVVAFGAAGQGLEGTWKLHSMFGANIENLTDAKGKVYYLVNNCLYRYDKTTKTTECLDKSNGMSDIMPTGIYYNIKKDYLVVTYQDFNIDVVLWDGRIVNVTAVKDAVLTSSKVLNDVTFGTGEMYVATDFGYLVIDDNNFRVAESHIFDTAVSSVARVGDNVVVAASKALYCSPVKKPHDVLTNFTKIDGNYDGAKLYPINDSKFFVNTTAALSVCTLSTAAGDTLKIDAQQAVALGATNVQATGSGFIANFLTQGYYYNFDAEGGNGTKVAGGKELFSSSAEGSLWALGTSGLHKDGDTEYAKPSGISLVKPYWIGYNGAQNKVYLTNSGRNGNVTERGNGEYVINTFDGNVWSDATPEKRSNGGPYWFTFDVKDVNTYYQATWTGGVYRVVDDKIVAVYNKTNSLMANNYKPATAMDSMGNLWVVQNYQNSTSPVMVLPKEKLQKENVEKGDWLGVKVPNVSKSTMQWMRFLITAKTNIGVLADGDYTDPVIFWDNKGNLENLTPDCTKANSFVDQTGKSFSWTYIYSLAEDSTGLVWLGATEGVIAFNPKDAFGSNFTSYRPVVEGGYLLDGVQCNAIVVDSENRKWIGTNNAGIYVVSADGTKVLQQYNTLNSMLPSNQVYQMAYANKTNSVFIVTPDGIAEFSINGRNPQKDYSGVYAYPNPVRPDFTGMVTIKGLMDNSFVTVKNSDGEVVATMQSVGDTATWSGCNAKGERLETGTYSVYASQTDGETPETPVAKIMIIK